MIYSKHLQLLPTALIQTIEIKQEFKVLNYRNDQTIWVVGSGSSYSQAIYLSQLLSNLLRYKVVVENPYSFVRYCKPRKGDYLIHITQEAKRLDNYSPVNFAKKLGLYTLLFTSKETELSKEIDEVYWFAPEFEKLLVACTSYIVPYLTILNWINTQLQAQNLPIIEFDLNEIIKRVEENITKTDFNFIKTFSTFLYSGLAKSVAVEAALKVNECLLLDSESYELKHFSHGKHFVSYNQPRIFNILAHSRDQDLLDVYQQSIFEPHQQINYMLSDLQPEIAVFDWASQMLTYINFAMKSCLIELENIPIRDKIMLPHGFEY